MYIVAHTFKEKLRLYKLLYLLSLKIYKWEFIRGIPALAEHPIYVAWYQCVCLYSELMREQLVEGRNSVYIGILKIKML